MKNEMAMFYLYESMGRGKHIASKSSKLVKKHNCDRKWWHSIVLAIALQKASSAGNDLRMCL